MKDTDIEILLHKKIVPLMKFKNPGKGFSTITKITETHIYYVRGNSTISLPITEFVNVCILYRGKTCTSLDLRDLNPKIFDSNKSGHSCNCTFLFCIARQLGLIKGEILGEGVRGNPFYVIFNS